MYAACIYITRHFTQLPAARSLQKQRTILYHRCNTSRAVQHVRIFCSPQARCPRRAQQVPSLGGRSGVPQRRRHAEASSAAFFIRLFRRSCSAVRVNDQPSAVHNESCRINVLRPVRAGLQNRPPGTTGLICGRSIQDAKPSAIGRGLACIVQWIRRIC